MKIQAERRAAIRNTKIKAEITALGVIIIDKDDVTKVKAKPFADVIQYKFHTAQECIES